jgi:hypothetical protein
MTGQQTTGRRLPEWAVMYVIHDAFRRDLQALEVTQAGRPAVRARWAVFADQLHFHHLAEDQVMWPPVRARMADDPDGLALMDARLPPRHPIAMTTMPAIGSGATGAARTMGARRCRSGSWRRSGRR